MPTLDPDDRSVLEGLATLPLPEVRARRAACQEMETQLSYVRRLVQGRLDIVQYELTRQRQGEAADDLPDLVAHLQDILADHVRAPGTGHLPTVLAPGEVDPGLVGPLDEITARYGLSDPAAVDQADLARAAEELSALERELSGRRRRMFDLIDTLQEEIVRRYQTGEATIDSLLSGD